MISCYRNIGGHTLGRMNPEIFFEFWNQNFNFSKEVFFGKAAEEFNITCSIDRQQDRATFHLKTPLVVKDDVKFMFYSTEVSIIYES